MEGQFGHRPRHALVIGTALNVGVEFGCGKAAVAQVAFELGHVDAIGGEAAERLEQSSGHIAHGESEAGHHRAVRRRPPGTFEDDKARRIVVGIFDAAFEDFQPIQLGSERRGDGAAARVAVTGNRGGGGGGVEIDLRLDTPAAQPGAHLAQRLGVAQGAFDLRPFAQTEQAMLDPDKMFIDDLQPRFRQQEMHIGDAAVERVFDGDDGACHRAGLHRLQRILERQARQHRRLGKQLAHRLVRIGSRCALEGHRLARRARRRCAHGSDKGFGTRRIVGHGAAA